MTTVLVVEDHQDIQDLLADVLCSQYEIQQAHNGAEAISYFGKQEPDLVLLDLMLPTVTGESVLAWIRKLSNVPVIVLTAVQDKRRTVALLKNGANDYVTKPFDIDELCARIEVQLKNIADPLAVDIGKLEAENVSISIDTHQVCVAGIEVSLPKKEFELLTILMKRPHQVFDKTDLYEAVWEQPYMNAENTLNVHLSNLRSKLNEAAGESRYIVSVWGIGVRFV